VIAKISGAVKLKRFWLGLYEVMNVLSESSGDGAVGLSGEAKKESVISPYLGVKCMQERRERGGEGEARVARTIESVWTLDD